MTSPLSFLAGLQPCGLADFVSAARPAGLYCLNNRVSFPGVQTVLRIQNETWGRLPDACASARYFETQDPIASATYELLGKTHFVEKLGNLNLIQYWLLSSETWYAPYNEWVLGQGADRFAKAQWFNAWNCKALEIAHASGLKLCLGSFATGEPELDVLPELYPMLRLARQYGGILDVHEYGVEGALRTSPSSGALRYRALWNVLPADCLLPIVVSEFWWGNGFEAGGDVAAQLNDAAWYGREIVDDPDLLWASAFQLDDGAESNFPMDAVEDYAAVAASIQTATSSTGKGGLHLRADGLDHNAAGFGLEIAALQAAHLTRAKLLTNSTFEAFDALLAAGVAAGDCVLRLYAAGDNASLGNPAQFFNEQSAWLARFAAKGGRYVEIHNEPNLDSEGFGHFWTTPAGFGGFFDAVARLIHSSFPALLVGWPGLAPRDDYAAWLPVIRSSIAAGTCDWVGAHAYWDSAANMDSDAQGRAYRRFRGLGKPVIVTECSNNVANDPDYEKGRQYGHFFLTLEDDVLGAFAFVSSASDPVYTTRRETWIRSNALTQIPAGVLDPLPVAATTQWKFDHFHLDGGTALTTNPLTITMNQAHTLEANAVEVTAPPAPRFKLTVVITPPGALDVVLDPPQPADGYLAGTVVTVTARPMA